MEEVRSSPPTIISYMVESSVSMGLELSPSIEMVQDSSMVSPTFTASAHSAAGVPERAIPTRLADVT